jgi:hypothetical protein
MATKKISDLTLASAVTDTANFAGDDSSQTFRFTGAQIKSYIQAQIADLMKSSNDILNLGLAASVSGNALTIALKTLGGSSDPSSTSPVRIGFRGTTAGTGDSSLVSATAATSLVISSGSTLGMVSGKEGTIYVYALNNGGTVELAASRKLYDDGTLVTTTAEGGAGAADSASVIYSTTARTTKAIRLIGRLTATEATAGTWATAPSEISVHPFSKPMAPTFQIFTSGTAQTYTVPSPRPSYLKVKMWGGGAGGGCSGTSNGTAATAGGSTTFGTSLLTAAGGSIGSRAGTGGSGGSPTVASPAIDSGSRVGNYGGPGVSEGAIATVALAGGNGGASGCGTGGSSGGSGGSTNVGVAAPANTGGGGGGASSGGVNNSSSGSGGGGGAYVEAIIVNPDATYTYTVGAGGTGQTLGGSGAAGGDGAAGEIIVEEHYF